MTSARGTTQRAVAPPGGMRRFLHALIRFPVLFFGVCAGALAASFLLMLGDRPTILIDYQVYRWAVQTWLAGGDVLSGGPTTTVGITLPWVYPPFALLPLSVVSLVPFTVGVVLLYAFDLLALGGTLYLVSRHLWPPAGRRVALAVAAAALPLTLFLEPVSATFGLGQVNVVLMGLIAADGLAERPRWPRGLLVGLAAAVKLTPAVFLVYFLVRRDYRAAATAAATTVVATGIGFVIDFPASVQYWFTQGPASGVSGSPYFANQSLLAGLARLGPSAQLRTIAWVLLCAVLVVAVGWAARRAHAPLALVGIGLLGLVASPTSWSDHWVWAAPGLLLMAGYAVSFRSLRWAALVALTAVVAVAAPFAPAPGGDGPEQAWSAWQHVQGESYLLVGLLLLVLLGLFGVLRPQLPPFGGALMHPRPDPSVPAQPGG